MGGRGSEGLGRMPGTLPLWPEEETGRSVMLPHRPPSRMDMLPRSPDARVAPLVAAAPAPPLVVVVVVAAAWRCGRPEERAELGVGGGRSRAGTRPPLMLARVSSRMVCMGVTPAEKGEGAPGVARCVPQREGSTGYTRLFVPVVGEATAVMLQRMPWLAGERRNPSARHRATDPGSCQDRLRKCIRVNPKHSFISYSTCALVNTACAAAHAPAPMRTVRTG